jgi:hypothetical protein
MAARDGEGTIYGASRTEASQSPPFTYTKIVFKALLTSLTESLVLARYQRDRRTR